MSELKEFPLDETTRGLIAEYNDQMITASNAMKGILNLVCRQNKLSGLWSLAPDGQRLLPVNPPEPQAEFTKTNGSARKK
jgi:hypothetical protein